jgi:release factor glutamine methyltransferase
LALEVDPSVLVPRPETELVVERALAHLVEGVEGRRVLDLATGSGAIALAIAHERPPCRVLGTDESGPAIALATANARRLGLANTRFETGSWYEPAGEERFHVITCNPPYVADGDVSLAWQVDYIEQEQALAAPGQLWAYGVDDNRHVLEALKALLYEQGLLAADFDLADAFAPASLDTFRH